MKHWRFSPPPSDELIAKSKEKHKGKHQSKGAAKSSQISSGKQAAEK